MIAVVAGLAAAAAAAGLAVGKFIGPTVHSWFGNSASLQYKYAPQAHAGGAGIGYALTADNTCSPHETNLTVWPSSRPNPQMMLRRASGYPGLDADPHKVAPYVLEETSEQYDAVPFGEDPREALEGEWHEDDESSYGAYDAEKLASGCMRSAGGAPAVQSGLAFPWGDVGDMSRWDGGGLGLGDYDDMPAPVQVDVFLHAVEVREPPEHGTYEVRSAGATAIEDSGDDSDTQYTGAGGGFDGAQDTTAQPDSADYQGQQGSQSSQVVQVFDNTVIGPAYRTHRPRHAGRHPVRPTPAIIPGLHRAPVRPRRAGGSDPREAIVRRGILAAWRHGEIDPPKWSRLRVGDYCIYVMNEPLTVRGLRLPTSFQEQIEIAKSMGALPITQAVSDARWAAVPDSRAFMARPLGDKNGEMDRDPSQVLRYNDLIGPNTGALTDGYWKELVLHPRLQPNGRGSMAQYGFRKADGSVTEHGGPSNHHDKYAGYSITPTYMVRIATKIGQEGTVDLLDELSNGSPLGGPLPAWLVSRLGGDNRPQSSQSGDVA